MLHVGDAQWSSSWVLGRQVRDPRFKLRPGQKFWSRFLFHVQLRTPTVPLGPQWHRNRKED